MLTPNYCFRKAILFAVLDFLCGRKQLLVFSFQLLDETKALTETQLPTDSGS
jgi:hypothetical protein